MKICHDELDDALKLAIDALADGREKTWTEFVRLAADAVWRVASRATPNQPLAETLFQRVFEDLHADRRALPAKQGACGLPCASAFLVREVDEIVARWTVDLFRQCDPSAKEVFVGVFYDDLRNWVSRAVAQRADPDDVVQEVCLALLAADGRRILLYQGTGSFRAYLRSVVVHLVSDFLRRDMGYVRPSTAFTRLSPLAQKAHRLLFEERLSRSDAVTRLADAAAAQAVEAAWALGDTARVESGRRPLLVAVDSFDGAFDPPDERPTPEQNLLANEALVERVAREAALIAALQALPESQRLILDARFLEGLKPREIATRNGLPVKDVYRSLERSLVRLKALLIERG